MSLEFRLFAARLLGKDMTILVLQSNERNCIDPISIFQRILSFLIYCCSNLNHCLSVKLAYHNMCLKLHPDRTHTNDCEKFRAMQKAYEVLMNPAKRQKYDSDGTVDEKKQVIYIVTDEILNKCRENYAGNELFVSTGGQTWSNLILRVLRLTCVFLNFEICFLNMFF